jgi:non-ribosomal peptide synthetase component F
VGQFQWSQVLVPSVAAALVKSAVSSTIVGNVNDGEAPSSLLPSLRLLILSGEPLLEALVSRVSSRLIDRDRCAVVNLYGSTEVSADCTAFDVPVKRRTSAAHGRSTLSDVSKSRGYVPLGKPMSGFAVAVVQVNSRIYN